MKMSIDGLVMLAGSEAIVVNRYLDSAKPPVWTIGIGHTAAAGGIDPRGFTGTLTIQQAIDLLQTDIVKYENGVNAAVKVPLKQHEFDALVSFHYNTGAIGRASFVDTLNRTGDRTEAALGMMQWAKPPEIRGRREGERDLFLYGRYAGNGMATAYTATNAGKVMWNSGRKVDVRALLTASKIDAPMAAPPRRSLWAWLTGTK